MSDERFATYPSLRGRTAVVTGASRGLGRAIVERLVAQGARVVAVSLHEDRATALREWIAGSQAPVIALLADVRDPEAVERVGRCAEVEFGSATLLVNCAGIITRDQDLVLSRQDWGSVLDTNVTGAFLMMQRLIPGMVRAGGGSIVNMTSQMARLPHPGASPSYEVSKAGLAALTRHEAMRHAAANVRVNSIAPGTINTGLADDMPREAFDRIIAGIPMGRMGDPDDIAAAVAFLLSDDSSYITGACLDINGGSMMP